MGDSKGTLDSKPQTLNPKPRGIHSPIPDQAPGSFRVLWDALANATGSFFSLGFFLPSEVQGMLIPPPPKVMLPRTFDKAE